MSGYYNRNNRGITKKLGPVTAYADAVLAGYKGTREQWAQDMAKLGQNVTQVAQNTKLTTELAEQTRVNTEQVEKDTADVRRLADETSDNAAQVASNTEESNRLAEKTKQAAAQAKADAEFAGAAADNFRVDATLSEAGKAAEAKTTGEKFARLSEEIDAEEAARQAAITQERNRAVARENEIENLFTMPTQEAVDKWLDEHPEATTTVQDKSLTKEKFTDDLKLHTIKDYVTPQMFGAKGDGINDDTSAIQAAFDYAQTRQTSAPSDNGDGTMYYGYSYRVYFPQGNYKITKPINVNLTYVDIGGDNASIFSSAEFALNITPGWYVNIKGLQFIECNNPITINGENTENGRVEITDCKFNNCMGASINIPFKQSYIGRVANCHFFKSEYVIKTVSCDLFIFENCWISERTRTKDYDSSFLYGGAELQIKSCLFVPYPTNCLEPCFIEGDARVLVTDTHFGAEPGSKPIVRATNKNMIYSIKDCLMSASYNPACYVLVSGGFERIVISNLTCFNDLLTPVRFSQTVSTDEQKAEILNNQPFIYIDQMSGNRKFPPPIGMYAKECFIDPAFYPYIRGDEAYIKYKPNLRGRKNDDGTVTIEGYGNAQADIAYPATDEHFCFVCLFSVKENGTNRILMCPVMFTTDGAYGSMIFTATSLTNRIPSEDISITNEETGGSHLYYNELRLRVTFNAEKYSDVGVNSIHSLYEESTANFGGPAKK